VVDYLVPIVLQGCEVMALCSERRTYIGGIWKQSANNTIGMRDR
jgi:hypothetical protein